MKFCISGFLAFWTNRQLKIDCEKKTVEIKICKWYKIVEVTGSGTLKRSLLKEDKRGKDDGEEIKIFVNNGWRELSKIGRFRCFFSSLKISLGIYFFVFECHSCSEGHFNLTGHMGARVIGRNQA